MRNLTESLLTILFALALLITTYSLLGNWLASLVSQAFAGVPQ